MRNIYKHAERVVIWIGTADADTIAGFEWIDRAAGLHREDPFRDEVANLDSSVVARSEEELNRARGFPPFKGAGSEKWEPVLKFFSRAWFGRVWVVQECAMAKEAVVMVGEHERDWRHIGAAIMFFAENRYTLAIGGFGKATKNAFGLWKWARSVDETEKKRQPLLWLLECTQMCTATDPRDRIYALLGLAKEMELMEPEDVDYKKEVVQVYTEATRLILRFSERGTEFSGLRILANVKHPKDEKDDGWPSWVQKWQDPDFDPLRKAKKERNETPKNTWSTFTMSNLPSSAKFHTGGIEYLTPRDTRPYDPFSILVQGFIFDTIASNVHLMDPLPLSRARLWDFVTDIRGVRKEWRDPYPTGEGINEVFALTLTLAEALSYTAASDAETYHDIDFQHFSLAMFDRTIKTMRDEGRNDECAALETKFQADVDELRLAVAGHDKSKTFANSVQLTCLKNKLFSSIGGYVGVGDIKLENDDLVCVLFGAKMPFILRPIGKRYRLVGECYFHGIMLGEALEEGRKKAQWFELR
jgi:hypothetical protein